MSDSCPTTRHAGNGISTVSITKTVCGGDVLHSTPACCCSSMTSEPASPLIVRAAGQGSR
jgi:hypothetical protein